MMSETVFVRNSACDLTGCKQRAVEAISDIYETLSRTRTVLAQSRTLLHEVDALAAAIGCQIDR